MDGLDKTILDIVTKEKLIIDIGKPSTIKAEELHSCLLRLPANTYLELFNMMCRIIKHSQCEEV